MPWGETENRIEATYANWTADGADVESEEISSLENAVPDIDEALKMEIEAASQFTKSKEAETSTEAKNRNNARLFYERYSQEIFSRSAEIGELFLRGQAEEARNRVVEFAGDMKKKVTESVSNQITEHFSEYESNQKKAEGEFDINERNRFYKLAAEALNFVPILGSAKMLGEALAGRTMAGENLSKGKRLLHATEGTVFLALDLTGVGIAAAEGMKSGRLVTRTAALMRKSGMAREAYTTVYKTGRFLVENPVAGKVADQAFKKIIEARKNKSNVLAEKSRELIFSSEEGEEDLAYAA